MEFKFDCLQKAVWRHASAHQALPELGSPARKAAYQVGAAFSELAVISRKDGSLVPLDNGDLNLEVVKEMSACFSGQPSVMAATGETLTAVINQGDVITLAYDKQNGVHAEYIPSGRPDVVLVSEVQATVEVGIVPFNIIQITYQ